MYKIVKSLIMEYGIPWSINRGLYSMKLKSMNKMSGIEKLFEKNVNVNRIDIFEINSNNIKKFLLKLSRDEKKEIIGIADKAINGIIKGFSSVDLNYGNPINWHINPLTKNYSDNKKKWYEIPDFNEELGDIKVIWEASRLTHFFYFTRAYMITEDSKYYNAFSDQLESWVKNNKYSYGANYKCGQECALRMINVLIAYSVFEKFGLVTDKDEKNVKKIIEGSYKKILSNFFYAHKCIKNNHTFSEISGLIIGAWCCEDNKRMKKAYNLLDKEIRNQFLEDGGFKQYSFNYQRFTLQIIECIYKVSNKTKIKIKENDRVKNSIQIMYQIQSENGDIPNYGSNDGALIFPTTSCKYRDFRPVLNTTYALITGKRLYKPGIYDEELLWFGDKDYYQIDEIKRKSTQFNKSGFYILRNENSFLVTYLQDYKSRPAHMDQLHIDLWINNKNILCDGGTYSYASVEGDFLSKTKAHNVIQLDDKEQMDKISKFMVCNWTKRSKAKFNENQFIGEVITQKGYRHLRNITQHNDEYIIEDKVYGKGKYCNLYFNTPLDVKVDNNKINLYDQDSFVCDIEVDSNEITIENAYRSLYYFKKDKTSRICIKKEIRNQECNIKSIIKLKNDRGR